MLDKNANPGMFFLFRVKMTKVPPLLIKINSACLPDKNDRPLYGTECFIAGYGYTVYDRSQSIPSKLQETSVPLIDYGTCAEWFHLENQRIRKLDL